MPEPILCPRCGASCEETQEFCNGCGFCLANPDFDDLFADAPRAGDAVKLSEPPAAVLPAEQETPLPQTAPRNAVGQSAWKKKQRSRALRLAGVIALVGCLAGGLAYAWHSRNQHTPAVQRSEPVFYLNGDALMLSLPQKDPICISAQPDTDQADFDAGKFYQNTVKLSEDGSRVFFLRSLCGTEAMLSYIDLSAPDTVHDATKICVSNLMRLFNSWNLIYSQDPEKELAEPMNPAFSLLDRHGGSVVFRDEDNFLCVWDGETGAVNVLDYFDTIGYWTTPQPDSETDMVCVLCCGLSEPNMYDSVYVPQLCLSVVCYPGADPAKQFTAEDDIVMWTKPKASSRYALFYRKGRGDDRSKPYILYFGDRTHPGITSDALPVLEPDAEDSDAAMQSRKVSISVSPEDSGVFMQQGDDIIYSMESFGDYFVFSNDVTIESAEDGINAFVGTGYAAAQQKTYSVDRIYPDHSALVDFNHGEAFYFWTQNENGSEMTEIGQRVCALSENAPAVLVWDPDNLQYRYISQNRTFSVSPDLGVFDGVWLSGDGSRLAADAGAFFTGSMTEESGMQLSKASEVTDVQNVWFVGESDPVYATQTDMYYRDARLAAYDADRTQAECSPDSTALYYYTDVIGETDAERRGMLYRFSGGKATLIAEQTAERFITENGVYYIAPDGETDALWFCGTDNTAVRLGEADTMLFTVNETAE